MRRRTLLTLGVAGGALLAAAGVGVAWWQPGWQAGRLTPAGRAVFAAVARAVLGDAVAPPQALAAHLERLEATIAGFPPALQAEVAELASLLAFPPGRLALTGLASDWPAATTADLQRMLQALRVSSLALRQQVYHALRDLTNAAWYAGPEAWPAIGYPGPRPL